MQFMKPNKPKKGDSLQVISPASCPKDMSKLDRGIAYLRDYGFEVEERPFARSQYHYLAGGDQERFTDLNNAMGSDSSTIIPTRGGYGCARLIPFMDSLKKPENPKVFMGYSDITSLHFYLAAQWNWVTYYGPMVAVEFGREDFAGSFTEKWFLHFLEENPDEFLVPELPYLKMETLHSGKAEGILLGGCLSIITPTLGTPCEPDFEGKILFLEEVGEDAYKCDRMIMNLANAGVFNKVKGVILGENIDCECESYDISLKEILKELLAPYKIPVILNAPFGHGDEKIIFPSGIKASMDADTCEIKFLEKIWED